VLVLVLDQLGFEYEYEYHFIEYEQDRWRKIAASKRVSEEPGRSAYPFSVSVGAP
jgi:hypothetical protein